VQIVQPLKITTPLTDSVVQQLRSGDSVSITGTLYVARDAAHRRLVEAMDRGDPLPFDPAGQLIYYMGPTPAKPARPIGSAGPTTSCRLDPYTPRLLEAGLKGMIGKGNRSVEVREALTKHCAVYLAAIGGAGALIAKSVKAAEIIAYEELGPEALLRLEVEHFSAIVINDIYGGDAYQEARSHYQRQ
jgi:fumarate hydratase subunit beta